MTTMATTTTKRIMATGNAREIVHPTADGRRLIRWIWDTRRQRYAPIEEVRGSAYEAEKVTIADARLAIERITNELRAQNAHAVAMAEADDLQATMDAASNRAGY